jgi:hypothetical protein
MTSSVVADVLGFGCHGSSRAIPSLHSKNNLPHIPPSPAAAIEFVAPSPSSTLSTLPAVKHLTHHTATTDSNTLNSIPMKNHSSFSSFLTVPAEKTTSSKKSSARSSFTSPSHLTSHTNNLKSSFTSPSDLLSRGQNLYPTDALEVQNAQVYDPEFGRITNDSIANQSGLGNPSAPVQAAFPYRCYKVKEMDLPKPRLQGVMART